MKTYHSVIFLNDIDQGQIISINIWNIKVKKNFMFLNDINLKHFDNFCEVCLRTYMNKPFLTF
jgi:hypothetical protein